MSRFDDARDSRPRACCRDLANLTPADGGPVSPSVLAVYAERCTVCGAVHRGATFAPAVHGIRLQGAS